MNSDLKKQLIERSFREVEEKKALFAKNPDNSFTYYSELKQLITDRGNLDLSNYRENYIERRFLHRLSSLNIDSYKEYIQFALNNPEEIIKMKDSLTIHTTEFFRDKTPFDYLAEVTIPLLIQQKKFASDKTLRIFSAPCSSGQEPYTLAMIIDDLYVKRGLSIPIELYACDVEPNIIQKAIVGQYQRQYMKGIPEEFIEKYFTHIKDDIYEVKDRIRSQVKFFTHNLFKPLPSWMKTMDIILCRNLLIYISRHRQLLVVKHLQNILHPNGYLILGKTESLLILNTKTDFIAENAREHIYQYIPK